MFSCVAVVWFVLYFCLSDLVLSCAVLFSVGLVRFGVLYLVLFGWLVFVTENGRGLSRRCFFMVGKRSSQFLVCAVLLCRSCVVPYWIESVWFGVVRVGLV